MAHILIADDEAATRDLVRRALESDGHKVVTAADGSEALSQLGAASAAFDLLISDVEMPGIDGIKLAAQALAATSRIRVLLMSGYADQLARAAALDAGRLRTLSKPFTLEKMRAEVKATLG